MMAPMSSWTNGQFPPHQVFIDLTRDDVDEEDDADQAKALLDAFTKPKVKVNESRPLKRKSPTDEPEVRELSLNTDTAFARPQPSTNGFKHAFDSNASVVINNARANDARPWSPLAAPGHAIKRESRGSTPKSFVTLPPTSTIRPDSSKISFSQPYPALRPKSESSNVPSTDSSIKSTFMAKKTPTQSHTRSPSIITAIEQTPKVMVVVPPPPSPGTSGGRALSKRKINRLPSVSSESDEESDPEEPKGVKQKYYPIEMYELQAERGRYPQVRSTKSDLHTLPIRSSPVPRARQRAPHGRKMYLREVLEKKLRAIQGPPVTMARDWDGTGILASNFEFTNTYKLQKGVTRVPEGFNYGCDCGIQCDPTKCTCLSKEEDSEELMVAYEYRNGKLLLKESFMNRKAMIFECSSLCPCLPTCWNRLVQHGRKIRLEIFHTGDRGFGLRSPDFIHRGQFIDTYLGEVITSAEAELREDATRGSNGSHSSPSYLFSLDWFPLSDDDDDEEEGGEYEDEDRDEDTSPNSNHYVVDGQRFGGPSRFMNHSCNPNCKMIPVSTHHGDQRIYDLAFFARRDIRPGTELTFDYNPGWSPDMNSDDPNAVKCLCGEARCRGQLWPNQRKSTNV